MTWLETAAPDATETPAYRQIAWKDVVLVTRTGNGKHLTILGAEGELHVWFVPPHVASNNKIRILMAEEPKRWWIAYPLIDGRYATDGSAQSSVDLSKATTYRFQEHVDDLAGGAWILGLGAHGDFGAVTSNEANDWIESTIIAEEEQA